MPITKQPLGRFTDHVAEQTPRSRRVAFIAGFYRFSAGLSALGLAMVLVEGVFDWHGFWSHAGAHPLALLSWPISIATSWWTGHLIGERRRFGAWIAISSIGLGVLNALSIRGVQATTPLVFAGIGLAAIASIWRELE